MPRQARVKTYDSIFHVMAKSISEVHLFQDKKDKLSFLKKVRDYQKLYEFRLYGYCLMDTHVHLIIDANGADISKIMHSINFSYALYFNKQHGRHGHLFQDRFKSKIINDDRYLMACSAYIHNNPTDMVEYASAPEKYEFSSLSIYLGLRQDPYELIDNGFIMSLFGKDSKTAREKYIELVYNSNDEDFSKEVEFLNEKTEYRGGRKILLRNAKPEDVIHFVAAKMSIPPIALKMKSARKLVDARALVAVLMRSLCNYGCNQIGSVLGNITQARISALSSIGIELILTKANYQGIVEEFMLKYAA